MANRLEALSSIEAMATFDQEVKGCREGVCRFSISQNGSWLVLAASMCSVASANCTQYQVNSLFPKPKRPHLQLQESERKETSKDTGVASINVTQRSLGFASHARMSHFLA